MRKTLSFWTRWKNKVESIDEEKGEEKGSAAVPTEVKPSENDIRPTEDSNMVIHLPEVDSGEAEEEETNNNAHDMMCKPPPQEEENEQAEEHLEEIMEELEEPVEDKSIRRRFLNWLNDVQQDHYAKKIARTYRKELEEGNSIYRISYMAPPVTRARREQRKRQKVIHRDEQRQKVKKHLDAYWEKKGHLKEELRLQEEERYEKWMAAHGLSIPESPPEEPKKRMSKWEKRFLRAKEFFFHQSS